MRNKSGILILTILIFMTLPACGDGQANAPPVSAASRLPASTAPAAVEIKKGTM